MTVRDDEATRVDVLRHMFPEVPEGWEEVHDDVLRLNTMEHPGIFARFFRRLDGSYRLVAICIGHGRPTVSVSAPGIRDRTKQEVLEAIKDFYPGRTIDVTSPLSAYDGNALVYVVDRGAGPGVGAELH